MALIEIRNNNFPGFCNVPIRSMNDDRVRVVRRSRDFP